MDVEVNGARLAVDEYGAGPAVVLVHGLGGSATDIWKNVTAELAKDFRVIAYDLRGSGRSEVTPRPYSIEILTDDLLGIVDARGLDSVAIVGHSLGGGIALRYAALRPDAVWAVVGVGAVAELNEQGRQGMHERAAAVEEHGMAGVAETVATNGLAASFRSANPEEYQELVSLLASNRPEGYAAQCDALVAMKAERLEDVSAPVLFVCGELDVPSPPERNREYAGHLQNAQVIALPDCAHIVPWEKPAELLAAVRPFLLEHAPEP